MRHLGCQPEGEVENAVGGVQAPRQVPRSEHSAEGNEFHESSTSGGRAKHSPSNGRDGCCTLRTAEGFRRGVAAVSVFEKRHVRYE
jgi:hypothetical protein